MEAIAFDMEFVDRPKKGLAPRFGKRDGQVSRLEVGPSTPSPIDVYRAEIGRRIQQGEIIREKLWLRALELVRMGTEDGIKIQSNSWRDFIALLNTTVFASFPALFLLENGNFRAVWRGDGATQVGLQFLGDGVIQYALITGNRHAYAAGRVRASDIKPQLKVYRLDSLVFA